MAAIATATEGQQLPIMGHNHLIQIAKYKVKSIEDSVKGCNKD